LNEETILELFENFNQSKSMSKDENFWTSDIFGINDLEKSRILLIMYLKK
jgi:hypothetical protein